MLSKSLLPEFDHEMALTRKVLERVPDEKRGWKPHPKSFSLGDLATHLANIPTWVGITLDQDAQDMAGGFTPPKSGTRDETLRTFDRAVTEARAKLAQASDAKLLGSWALKTGDTVHFEMPRMAVLRGFVMNHMIHHRGQLTVYLRLLDVRVPSVYGPSADESGM